MGKHYTSLWLAIGILCVCTTKQLTDCIPSLSCLDGAYSILEFSNVDRTMAATNPTLSRSIGQLNLQMQRKYVTTSTLEGDWEPGKSVKMTRIVQQMIAIVIWGVVNVTNVLRIVLIHALGVAVIKSALLWVSWN